MQAEPMRSGRLQQVRTDQPVQQPSRLRRRDISQHSDGGIADVRSGNQAEQLKQPGGLRWEGTV